MEQPTMLFAYIGIGEFENRIFVGLFSNVKDLVSVFLKDLFACHFHYFNFPGTPKDYMIMAREYCDSVDGLVEFCLKYRKNYQGGELEWYPHIVEGSPRAQKC